MSHLTETVKIRVRGELASHPERIIEIPGRDDEGGLTLIARFVVKLLAREV